jgi:hypothetical protein
MSATFDSILNEVTVNRKGATLIAEKTSPTAATAYLSRTMWTATGHPEAGAYPTIGAANGRACSKTTAGAMGFPNAPTGKRWKVLNAFATLLATGASNSTLYIYDRLADVQIAHDAASGNFTGFTGAARLGSTAGAGDGGFLAAFVSSNLSATGNVFTFTYTNQHGIAGQVTPSFTSTASALAGNPLQNHLPFIPLAQGDRRVRSVESFTRTNAGTGSVELAIIKPICVIPMPSQCLMGEKEYLVELPREAYVRDDACLFGVQIGQSPQAQLMWGLNLAPVPL